MRAISARCFPTFNCHHPRKRVIQYAGADRFYR